MVDSPKPIRILLVDDHRSMLWGLDKLIGSAWPRMQVVATATDGCEALAAAARHLPDLVLLDVGLGDVCGLDLLPELNQCCDARVLIITGISDPKLREVAVLRGAMGVVHKMEDADVILKAIDHIHRGEIWLDRATTAKMLAAVSAQRTTQQGVPDDGGIGALTPKEREIIAALVAHKGAQIKVIAASLSISVHTVSNHLASIYGKLGVHSRLELFMYAKEHGLADLSVQVTSLEYRR